MRDLWNLLRERITVYSTTGIIFLAAAGLILLIWPGAAMVLICRLLGLMLLIYGIVMLVHNLKFKSASFRTGLLVLSCILIIIGASILGNPLSLVRIFGTLLALFLIVYGLFSLYRMIRSQAQHSGRWWLLTAGAVFELVIGILLLAAPVRTSALVLRLLGLVLLLSAGSAVAYRTRFGAAESSREDIIDGTARDVTDDTDKTAR